ncbi:hypothetical protein [Methylobacterium sp. Leaf100]|uniref:hypothetical protein n=1 Tax=Methylobacterium sp. Leaf100 TaxID=1736252 RepID=UPI0006FF58E5|nr:hypothetical protein [Methylobacterium sp. Leaf100]KQP19258.1 hypothetical protein ASF25_21620 [Methylobacterium sp. Leaf100]
MSALAIVRGDDSVTIASDGAGYEAGTGILMTHVSKVEMMPECSCIFASRGMGGASAAMHNAFRQLSARGAQIVTFDDVLDLFPELASELFREASATKAEGADEPHFSFMIGGFSEDRERYESYTLRTRPFSALDATGKFIDWPPYSLIPLPDIHLAPSPTLESAAKVGITRPQELQSGYEIHPQHYALKAVAACRLDREQDEVEGTAGIHFVGGMLQMTTVQREAVFSQVVHRLPDPIGEPIDPSRGQLLPQFLQPQKSPDTEIPI